MNYQKLISGFRKKGIRLISYGKAVYPKKSFPLYKIRIPGQRGRKMLITSGFHGEEFNGPISLLKNIREIIAYAKEKGIDLTIYPCVNPSGFDARKRYNISDEVGNNTFMLYQLKNKKWLSDLKPHEKFLQFKLAPSPAREIRLLQADLRRQGFFRRPPATVLDIHQDDELASGDFYAYIYNKRKIYEKIMKAAEKFGKRARNEEALVYIDGRRLKDHIDSQGFIVRYDGTLTDMFWRIGARYSATIETNVFSPLSKIAKINLVWIKSLIDLTAAGK